jgi:hypothetical protein
MSYSAEDDALIAAVDAPEATKAVIARAKFARRPKSSLLMSTLPNPELFIQLSAV